MADDEIKNVLVVGAPGTEASKFIKTFGAYLNCNTHEEAIKWKPNLTEYCYVYDDVKDITKTTILIERKTINFIYASSLDNGNLYDPKHIMLILLHYLQKQKFTAILFLVKPDEYEKYKSHLFSGLKQFAQQNIFYVCNKDEEHFEEIKKYVDASQVQRNIFYFQKSVFYEISEDYWQQGVEFSKSIFNNIVGNDIINGPENYYIESIIPERSVLKLAEDLMMLLIQVYICADYTGATAEYHDRECYNRFYIGNYKNYATTCYGCAAWTHTKEGSSNMSIKLNIQKFLKCIEMNLKIPNICHVPCKCIESDADISKCIIFEPPNITCSECNCNINLHSKQYFNLSHISDDGNNCYENINNMEKRIAIKMLSTFFLYKIQNLEVYDVLTKCRTLLDMNDVVHKQIFNHFQIECNNEVSKLKATSNFITDENIIKCLNILYLIKHNATIIPKFVQDVFPKDFRLEIARDEQIKTIKDVETECETCNINNETMETLRNENVEMKQMLQNANDLNSKLIQDMQTLTEQCRLNQNEEEPKD